MGVFREILWQLIQKNVGLSVFLLATLLIGTFGYSVIGGGKYSLIDCLYMTVITILTIGYSEIIDLSHSPGGRVFTMVIAFSGIGIATYSLSNFTSLMVEGRLKEVFWRKRMERKIEKLRKHYIICSAEDVGFYVATELSSTKRPFVIIEMDKGKIEKATKAFPEGLFIEGDPTDSDTLLKAGVREAAGLFSVTDEDNQNLVISLAAKQLNPSLRVVSRCKDLKNMEMIKKAGADSVVSPAFIGGLRIASEMIRPTVVSFLDVMLRDRDLNLRVEEIPVPGSFAGRPIRALNLIKHPHFLLLAVKKGEKWFYHPPEDEVLQSGDTLIFMTTPEERLRLEDIFASGPF
jgi:voltage-gated potassium channel